MHYFIGSARSESVRVTCEIFECVDLATIESRNEIFNFFIKKFVFLGAFLYKFLEELDRFKYFFHVVVIEVSEIVVVLFGIDIGVSVVMLRFFEHGRNGEIAHSPVAVFEEIPVKDGASETTIAVGKRVKITNPEVELDGFDDGVDKIRIVVSIIY